MFFLSSFKATATHHAVSLCNPAQSKHKYVSFRDEEKHVDISGQFMDGEGMGAIITSDNCFKGEQSF